MALWCENLLHDMRFVPEWTAVASRGSGSIEDEQISCEIVDTV